MRASPFVVVLVVSFAAREARAQVVPEIVTLHVDSPVPVAVFGHVTSFGVTSAGDSVVIDTPTRLCVSPCDTLVDVRSGADLSVAGRDAVESPRFTVDGLVGPHRVEVSPGSPVVRAGGVALTAIGAAAVGIGAVLGIGGALSNHGMPAQVSPSTGQVVRPATEGTTGGMETAGIVTGAAGLALLVAGIVLLSVSATDVAVY